MESERLAEEFAKQLEEIEQQEHVVNNEYLRLTRELKRFRTTNNLGMMKP